MPGRLDCWPTRQAGIARIAREARLPVLFEIWTSDTGAYTAVSADGVSLPLWVYPSFAKSGEAKLNKVEELVKKCSDGGERTVHIGGFTFGLLICGENNVLANKQRKHNEAYVRFDAAPNLFGHLQLIFNGAHTKMGEWGKLEKRFEFLSSRKRWVLYATNNARSDEEEALGWGASTLRAYYNGSRIATSKGKEPRCPVDVSIISSGDDRCTILTLDIPGRLLL